jgi:hypothetical protein
MTAFHPLRSASVNPVDYKPRANGIVGASPAGHSQDAVI